MSDKKLLNFITPHCHIKSFDAASTAEKFAKKEEELGTGFITITDHGTLEGVRQVYDLCHGDGKYKDKLTPILGLEAYFRDDNCEILDSAYKVNGSFKDHFKYSHLTLHMLDQKAFSACSRILSIADKNAEHHGGERKPLFTWKDLEELGSYNITMTSGCLIGMVGRHILKNNDFQSASKYYEKLRSLVKPGNFYVEVFPHVCDRNYDIGVFVVYDDGTEDKFPVWKNLKTKDGEIKAEFLANEFKADAPKAASKHLHVYEVMVQKKWTQIENPKKISRVEKREGFLVNECQPWCPNGDVQLGVNKFLIGLAEKHGDPILVSDDSHFAVPEEHVIQNIRLAQRDTKRGLSGTWRFSNSHHRLSTKDAQEYMKQNLSAKNSDLEKWVENSYQWANRFKDFRFETQKSIPTKFFPKDTLKHTMDIIAKQGRMNWGNEKYVNRLKAEIELLHKNGTIDLLPYFFIDQEACELYLKNGVITGPGRGSAAGLLLAYLIGITHVDPLKYGLSMDRFMTLERIKSGKLPDVDQDLPSRDLLVDPNDPQKGWLKDRFGDCVAQICVETTLKLKSSIKDVFRALHGQVPPNIEVLCKQLPVPPQGVPDKDFIFGYDANGVWVNGLIDTDENLWQFTMDYPKEWDMVKELIGLVRQKSRHASAFLISEVPVREMIPLTLIDNVETTQFNAIGVEAMGGLKMDFLNVLALKDIQSCLKLIQDRHVKDIDWSLSRQFQEEPPHMILDGIKVPHLRLVPFKGRFYDVWDLPEDQKVFNSICEGNTESVFQFNTNSAKIWLEEFNNLRYVDNNEVHKGLDSIKALSAFTALDRPGPLDANVKTADGKEHNMLVEYANRAKGGVYNGSNYYLNEALPETFGILCYQEDLEKIFKELGKTTAGEAEAFRRAVAKKDVKKVLRFKETFIPGASQELGETLAEDLWSQMVTFGQYGFNKSHSVCYVTIAYACAFLKHHYPLEWWTGVLKNAEKKEIDEKFWAYCGHLIDLPNVQNACDNFEIKGERIQSPLSMLDGIGTKAHDQLVAGAPYLDIDDFCKKIQQFKVDNSTVVEKIKEDKKTGTQHRVTVQKLAISALNSRVVSTLIISGAMDKLFPEKQKISVDNNEVEVSLTTSDKILMYQDALERASGKKIPASKKKELVEKFKDLDEIQQFQLKKKVLPSFSVDLLWPCTRLVPEVVKEHDGYYYKSGRKPVRIYESKYFKAMDLAGKTKVLPIEGLEASFVAYVISEKRFSFERNGIKKTAIKIMVDIGGERREFVQWPDDENKLPREFNKNIEGSVVLLTIKKKNDKILRLNRTYVLRSSVLQNLEEESPE